MLFVVFFFFFKQKTAYEMRISDWSSTCALPISCLSAPAPRIVIIWHQPTKGFRRALAQDCHRFNRHPADAALHTPGPGRARQWLGGIARRTDRKSVV